MAGSFNVGSIFAKLSLDGKDVRAAISGILSKLRNFARRASSAFAAPRRAALRFGKALKTVTGIARSFVQKFTSIRGVLAGVATAFGAGQFTKFTADVENAERAFGNLALSIGEDAETALQKLRVATRGTVSDLDLLKQANAALILGVGESSEDLAELATIARRLGQATGRTAAEGFQDLVVGIGRQSRLILDNLGLIVSVGKANEEFAARLGKTASQLTDVEKRQAFLNATLEAARRKVKSLGPDVLTFGDILNKVTASIQNFFAQLSRNLNPALRELFEAFNRLEGTGLVRSLGASFDIAIRSFADFVDEQGPTIISFFEKLVRVATQLRAVVSELGSGALENIAAIFSGDDSGERLAAIVTAPIIQIQRMLVGIGQLIAAGLLETLGLIGPVLIPLFKSFGIAIGEGLISAMGPLITSIDLIFGEGKQTVEQLESSVRASQRNLKNEQNQLRLAQGKFNLTNTVFQAAARQGNKKRLDELRGERKAQADFLRERVREVEIAREVLAQREQALIEGQGRSLEAQAEAAIGKTTKLLEDGLKNLREGSLTVVSSVADKTIAELDAAARRAVDAIASAVNIPPQFSKNSAQRRKEIEESAAVISANAAVSVTALRENVDLFDELSLAVRTLKSNEGSQEFQDMKERAANLRREIERLTIVISSIPPIGVGQTAARATLLSVLETLRARAEESDILKATLVLLQKLKQAQMENRDAIKEGREENRANKATDVALEKIKLQLKEDQLQVDERRRILTGGLNEAVELQVFSFRRQLVLLGASKDQVEAIAIVYERILKANKAITDEIKKQKGDEKKLKKDEKEELAAREAQIAAFQNRTNQFTQDLTFSIIQAIENSESAWRTIADVFRRELERQLSDMVETISKKLGESLANSFGSSALGQAIGQTLFIAASIALAEIARREERGARVTEIPVEEIATSQAAIRGVVAGPQNIAIAEVGSAIREANRGVESLLREGNDLFRRFIGDAALSSGGAAAGTV